MLASVSARLSVTSLALLVLLISGPVRAEDQAGESQKAQIGPDTAETPKLLPLQVSYNASMDKGISLNGSALRTLEELSLIHI